MKGNTYSKRRQFDPILTDVGFRPLIANLARRQACFMAVGQVPLGKSNLKLTKVRASCKSERRVADIYNRIERR